MSQAPVSNAKNFAQLFRILNHLVHGEPGGVVVGRGQHKLLDLLELVHAEDAARVPPVGANFLSR